MEVQTIELDRTEPLPATDPMVRPGLRARQVTLLVACLSVVAAVAGVMLRDAAIRRSLPFVEQANDPRQVLPWAVTFSAGGAALWSYRGARPVGLVMLVSGALTGFGALCMGLESFIAPSSDSVLTAVDAIGGEAALLGSMVALVLLPQVFPDGLLPGRLWRLVAWVSTGAVVVCGLNLVVGGLSGDPDWPWSVLSVVLPAASLAGLVSLAVRWRGADRPLRRQVLGSLVLSLSALTVLLVASLPALQDANVEWLMIFWPIGTAVVLLVAVVRNDLYEIRTTARRAAVYAVTVGVLSGVFALVYVVVLAALWQRVVDGLLRWVALVVATTVILAMDPLRRRLLIRIERQLLGQRSDPLPALSRIGSASSLDRFTTIVDTVATALRSPGVVLSVQEHDEVRVAASCGDPCPDALVLPLSYGGELVGELAVTPRTPGERFQPADDKLLGLLATQAATELYVARRDAELTLVRQETLQRAAALRAQLGQDLHDGLAPLLAGASLSADALRRGMPSGSRDEADAARLTDRLLQASTEVRRLAHDLQSTVHDRGLVQAITDHIAGLSGPGCPQVSAEIRVDDLPPAVTEAAYLIVLEAINNAVRHGCPRHVWVRLEQRPAQVSILVEDDGEGISQPYVSGLGIASMRRRADALDGSLQLLPRPGGGTVLTTTLRYQP